MRGHRNRVLSLGDGSLARGVPSGPPFPPVDTVAAPCGSPAVPHLRRYYEGLRLLATHPRRPPVSLGSRYLPDGRRWRALLGSWKIPVEACPELGTPADPSRPRHSGRPGTAFRKANDVGIRDATDFGAEPSRPASSLCTLRTHQSPGEWQHSLRACLLALARRDLHPLDSI